MCVYTRICLHNSISMFIPGFIPEQADAMPMGRLPLDIAVCLSRCAMDSVSMASEMVWASVLALPLPNCMSLDPLCSLAHPFPGACCPLATLAGFLLSSQALCSFSSFCMKSPLRHVFTADRSLRSPLLECHRVCPRVLQLKWQPLSNESLHNKPNYSIPFIVLVCT